MDLLNSHNCPKIHICYEQEIADVLFKYYQSKFCKILNTFLFCSQIKCWFNFMAEIHKNLVRIANSEGPGQTASSD